MATSSNPFGENATKVPMVLDTLTGQIRPLAPGEQISARFVEAPKFLNLGQVPPTIQLQKDYVELYQRMVELERKYCECTGEPVIVPCPEPEPCEECPEPEPCEECPPAGVVASWELATQEQFDDEIDTTFNPVYAGADIDDQRPLNAEDAYFQLRGFEGPEIVGTHLEVTISHSNGYVGYVFPFIAKVSDTAVVDHWEVEWLIPYQYQSYYTYVTPPSTDFWDNVLPLKENPSEFGAWAESDVNTLRVFVPMWGSGDSAAYAVGIFRAFDDAANCIATLTMSGAFAGW